MRPQRADSPRVQMVRTSRLGSGPETCLAWCAGLIGGSIWTATCEELSGKSGAVPPKSSLPLCGLQPAWQFSELSLQVAGSSGVPGFRSSDPHSLQCTTQACPFVALPHPLVSKWLA